MQSAPTKPNPGHEVDVRTVRRNTLFWMLGRLPMHGSIPFRELGVVQGLLVGLGASNLVIGLVGLSRTVSVVGFLLGGFLSDRTLARRRLLLGAAGLIVWPYLFMCLVLVSSEGAPLGLVVGLLCVALAAASAIQSAGMLFQSDLYSRAIPRAQRGRVLGVSVALGGLSGVGASLGLTWLLFHVSFPYNYALAFPIGGLLAGVAYTLTSTCRPLRPMQLAEAPRSQLSALADVWRDRPYRTFLLLSALRMVGIACMFFVVPVALVRFDLPAYYVGLFALMGGLSAVVGSPLAGWIADRFGRGVTAMVGGLIAACGFLLVAWMPGGPTAVAAYGVVRIGARGLGLSVYLTAMEIAPSESRGTYLSARYSSEHLTQFGMLPLVGWVLDRVDAGLVFASAAALVACAGVLLWHSRRG